MLEFTAFVRLLYLFRLQNSQEKRLNITIHKHEEEKVNLKNHYSTIVKVQNQVHSRMYEIQELTNTLNIG